MDKERMLCSVCDVAGFPCGFQRPQLPTVAVVIQSFHCDNHWAYRVYFLPEMLSVVTMLPTYVISAILVHCRIGYGLSLIRCALLDEGSLLLKHANTIFMTDDFRSAKQRSKEKHVSGADVWACPWVKEKGWENELGESLREYYL